MKWKPLVLLLAAVVACAPQAEDRESSGAAAPVAEIPVTSASTAAVEAFEEGQRLADIGRGRQANKLFKQATEEDATFAYAYLQVANTAASALEFKTYLDLAKANLEGKSEGERLLVEIVGTFLDNDAERRLELSSGLVEAYPESPRAWLTRGAMQATLNQHQASRESIRRALALQPDLIAAHVRMANSFLFNEPKDFDRALAEMETVIQLDPQEAKGYEGLGDVLRARNELEAAREAYSRALEVDPALSVAALKKGHIDSFLGRFEEARADYDLGIAGAEGSDRPNYANYRAFAWLHAGDPDAALAELHDLYESVDHMGLPADQVRATKIFTLDNAATVALHFGKVDAAEEILEERSRVVRSDALALGDESFSRRQEAGIALRSGRLAARRGEFDTARALAEQNHDLLAADSNPRRFEGYHGLLGQIALARGEFDAAVAQYEQANLTVTYIRYQLAMALAGAGRAEEARELFQEVAEWNFNSVGFALVRRDALAQAG